LFGEMLPAAPLAQYERQLAHGFDVVIAIGTSAGFPYISGPLIEARARGATTIEINPDETILSAEVSIHLAAPALDALRVLDRRIADT